MVSFIESASDTDIISYAVTGKAAPVEFDKTLYETALLSIIKESILDNPEMFIENEDYTIANFINEIGTLSNISSTDILREEDAGKSWGNSNADHKKRSGYTSNRSNEFSGVSGSGSNTGNEARKAQSARANEFGSGQADSDARNGYVKMPDPTGKTPAGGFTSFFKNFKNDITGSEAWGKISNFVTSGTGKAIGVSALVAAASFIAYKVYKNYFSKAAKACAGKSGAAKTACMAKAKQQAQRARIAALSKGKSLASKTNNPRKARAALANKIASIKK